MRRKGKDMNYKIKIKGALDQSWSNWLGNAEIASELQADGSAISTLTVDTADQATLFGILDRIRDLHIPLITVISDEDKVEN
jgi:hypothetical protein